MNARDEQIAQEQSYITDLYRRLDALRRSTTRRLADVRKAGPSGSPQNRSERDAFATLYEDRLAQLNAVEDRLCFGRLDLDAGEQITRYIGRIGLSDDDHEPILTDWRAPAAEPFYQATARNHMGVTRRRHILTKGRTVTDVEDDVLDVEGLSTDELAGLSGEGALFAALNAHRTGRMTDIVATIQAEQDAIIREELGGVLVVQGGPGTGKTAVALHRAAYLLYTHRERLERTGVLLVGPNRRFLHYIDQVLPSLGETGAVTARVADLFPGVVADGVESDEVAELKGRSIWPRILERAVAGIQRLPQDDLPIDIDGRTVVLTRTIVAAARDRARRLKRPHNVARIVFVRDVLDRLVDQLVDDIGFTATSADRAELHEDLRTTREVRIAVNLAWMPTTAQKLLEDLYARPDRLAAAAPELTEGERALLARPRHSAWTPADVPLLDEAAELLGEDDQANRRQARLDADRRAQDVQYAREVLANAGNALVSAETLADRFADSGPVLTTAERAAADRTWAYGHVVVDEAQELSAMAWRLLLRRCPTRSMTVVGDIAQTSAAGGTRRWSDRFESLPHTPWRLRELTVNYRTPAQIMDKAAAVAVNAGLYAEIPRSVRQGERPIATTVATAETIVQRAATAAWDELERANGGMVAVIAPERLVDEIAAAIGPVPAVDGIDRLAVLRTAEAKGLEFDTVVLVEPAVILRSPSGASDIYVAMSRPTQALHVVHSEPLPEGF